MRRVLLEGRLQRLVEANGFRRYDMHERSALHSGEDLRIDRLRVLRLAENHAGARTAQTFVRRAGDKVGIRHRSRMHTARDKSGNVRHVDKEQSAD